MSATLPRTSTPRLLVNGKFLAQPQTGVQRYAYEVASRLCEGASPCEIAVPGLGVSSRLAPELCRERSPAGLQLWEQGALAAYGRRDPEGVMVSLCNSGPLPVRNQLVVLHDAAPAMAPHGFSRRYTQTWRMRTALLVSRVRLLATVSRSAAQDIADVFGREPDLVLEPGLPRGFASDADDGVETIEPYALLVGAHDPRKGLSFLLEFWEEVHAATGMRLLATRRAGARVFSAATDGRLRPWLDVVDDPDDEALRRWMRGATWLLQPSQYEGFGLPLVEAAALGTPFLSSPTGVAAELAGTYGIALPRDVTLWRRRLVDPPYPRISPAERRRLRERFDYDRTAADLREACAAVMTP